MARDLNIFPYFDTSAAEYAKKYKEILFAPGRVVQGRELTGAQTLQHLQQQTNWETLYKNGSIISGMDITISIDPYSANNNWAKMSSGYFYFDGRVLQVDAQSILIDGTGLENLGVYINEEFITASTDETLKDPATFGMTPSNYGLVGSDRLKIIVELVKILAATSPEPVINSYIKYEDENNVKVVWNLLDGEVQNYIRKPDYSLLSQTLAKRTMDANGHFLVEGMKLSTEKAYSDSNIKVVVGPGTCYVKGFDNTFVVPRSVDVSKALNTEDHTNEPHTYNSGTSRYTLIYPFVVTDSLVKDVEVIAIILKTDYITRGSGDYDVFTDVYGHTYTSIESIIDISGYIQGVDYELSGDQVHWLAGSRPSVGTDYTIQFRYYKTSIRDTEYIVIQDPYSPNNIYYIKWLGVSNPDDLSIFLVNYSTYFARTDLVSIDKFGNIVISSGVSTSYDKTLIPPFADEMLPIGWVKFLPGLDWDSCILYEYNFLRTTMFELHYLKKRVDDLEENVAALALEGEMKEGEASTSLKGIFVDPFNTLYKADLGHSEYYASTNMIDGQLLMCSNHQTVDLDRALDTRTAIKAWTDENAAEQWLTLNKTAEQTFFAQNLKSELYNLNPFGFISKNSYAKLTPDSDHWVDTKVVEKTVVNNQVVNSETNIHQLQWVSNPTSKNEFVEQKVSSIGQDKLSYAVVSLGDKLATYARQLTLTLTGSNFHPAATLYCVFAGKYAFLTAVSPYRNYFVGGVNTGKIIVAADGTFKATFVVPAGTPSGNIECSVIDDSGNSYKVVYQSKGIQKIIENRTTITKSFDKQTDIYQIVVQPKVPIDPVTPPIIINDQPEPKPERNLDKPTYNGILIDPVAQSFIFKDDKVLIALDLFFGTKAGTGNHPVYPDDYYNTSAFSVIKPAILTIGMMKSGFPDAENVLHKQTITPEQITTSLYGTVATHITLTKPIYFPAMKDFYISIGSDSTEYSIFTATVGAADLSSGNQIMKQAYQDGSMFASSNGITWNAIQTSDLAIKLYEGVYSSTGTIQTETLAFPKGGWTGYGRFLYTNDYIELPNTKIDWYYSIDAGTTWTVFNPSDEINTALNSTQLTIKAILTTKISSITPIVKINTNLIFFQYDTSKTGIYRTKNTADIPAYSNVKMIIDENTPSTTSLIKEFSTDAGVTFYRLVAAAIDSVDIGNNFFRNTYIFDFMLLQRLTVDSTFGFAVGDSVYVPAGSVRGKVCKVDTVNEYLYVLLTNSGITPFPGSGNITNGVATTAISSAYDYDSEPTWPVQWTGRVLLESTSFWKSSIVANYRSVMKTV